LFSINSLAYLEHYGKGKIYYVISCSIFDIREECENYGCYWWDNSCHNEPKPIPAPAPAPQITGFIIQNPELFTINATVYPLQDILFLEPGIYYYNFTVKNPQNLSIKVRITSSLETKEKEFILNPYETKNVTFLINASEYCINRTEKIEWFFDREYVHKKVITTLKIFTICQNGTFPAEGEAIIELKKEREATKILISIVIIISIVVIGVVYKKIKKISKLLKKLEKI